MPDANSPAPAPGTTDNPVQAPVPERGTPEHDRYLSEKYDAHQRGEVFNWTGAAQPVKPDADNTNTGTPKQPAGVAQRPDNVPEKFWDAEKGVLRTDELLKANAELEKQFTKNKQADPATPPAEGTDGNDGAPADGEADNAKQVVSEAGFDFDVFQNEYNESGALSDESIARLEKAGISRQVVDSYIAGQEALGARIIAEIHAVAGGPDEYSKVINWAKTNVPAEDIAAFNEAVQNGSRAESRLAVAGLAAQYKLANGSAPSLLNGNGARQSDEAAYASRAQMVEAMHDPRYAKDPAYRAQVDKRVGASPNFF